jgi:hypothetical protein
MNNKEGIPWREEIAGKYHKYEKAFDCPSDQGELPWNTHFDCKLQLKKDHKSRFAKYQLVRSEEEEAEEAETIQNHLKRQWIEEIWNAIVSCAMVFVQTIDSGQRYCQDCRDFNNNTKAHPYKIKNIDNLLDRVKGKHFGR